MILFTVLPGVKGLLSIVLFLCLLLAGSPSITFAGESDAAITDLVLVIGKISSNPKRHYQRLKPIADYVVSKMGDLGYTHARVLMAKDRDELISFLKKGRVDWVTEKPFLAKEIHERAGAEFFLRRWKKGVPEYHTVFFTRNDSGIESIDDLRGKTIAFEDPDSTSAYYIPADILIRQGLNMVRLNSPKETAPQDSIGYVFAGQEITMSTWVYKGVVDAAAFSNLDFNNEKRLPALFREQLSIMHRSKSYPRSIELVRKDLPEAVKQRLREVLLHAHEDSGAALALKAYQGTAKFDELGSECLSVLHATSSVRKMVDETLKP